jgi:thymidylate synthase
MEISTDTIEGAFHRVTHLILREGDEIEIPDYGLTLEYPEPIVLRVHHPNYRNHVSDAYPHSKDYLDAYAHQLTHLSPDSGFAYTYGNRLRDYPIIPCNVEGDLDRCKEVFKEDFCGFCGNGNGCGVNQIDFIANTLSEDLTSRRAIAITRFPEIDCYSKNPPCLTMVQCKIRDNKLHMTCYFRSNDMFAAWYANAWGLTTLMETIITEIELCNPELEGKIKMGTLTTISECPHIYIERDKSDIDRFRSVVYYAV